MFNSGNCATPFTMPVAPACGNMGGGMGGWGNDWIALAILALIFGDGWGMGGMGGMGMFLPFMMMNGGWGGFGGNGCGGNCNANAIEASIQRGFDNQGVMNKLNGIEQGVCNLGYENLAQMNSLGMAVSNGFHGVDNAICTLGYQTQQGFNQATIANLQGQNALQAQLCSMSAQNQACCCETQRLVERGFADTNYNLATNTCNVLNTMNNNTRDIIESNNAGTRAILDYLCQKENADLRAENQNLRLEKSQTAQNAFIAANQSAQTAELIRRLGADCPQPAYVVQPPQPVTFPTNCCGGVNFAAYGNGYNNGGCGCGNNSGCGCC